MKYINKPGPVDALQLTEEFLTQLYFGGEIGEPLKRFKVRISSMSSHQTDKKVYKWRGYIDTPKGEMLVLMGDWVIKKANGDCWAYHPDLFNKKYEKVVE